MKHYTWVEPDFDEEGNYKGPITMIWSEQQILDHYWDHWEKAMIAKYGERALLITEDNCIQDFCVVHWAVEVNDEPPTVGIKPSK